MSALTNDRNTPSRLGDELVLPVAAATRIYAGSLTVIDAEGNAIPGKTATGLKAAGRAEESVNNLTGAAGDQIIKISRGVFRFANDSADPITAADILETCYIVDDQAVSISSGGDPATRSEAGQVFDVDSGGVWVKIG
jgi:hypothetical protein